VSINLFDVFEEQYELEEPALLQVYSLYLLYTFPDWQKADPVYPEVPQSESLSHSTFWSTHVPEEHVWFAEQSSNNLFSDEFEQYELEEPALLQVYSLYLLYTFPDWQKADPVHPSEPQSVFDEHSTFEHDPLEQIWFEEQFVTSLSSMELEHLADAVPGLEQV